MDRQAMPWAGVELGGTKTIVALARGGDLVLREQIPTGTPAATLGQAAALLARLRADHGPFGGLGIASFGPVGVTPGRPDHGRILATPKPGWRDTDVLGPLQQAAGCPALIDTDVAGAALAEGRWGAAQGLDTHVYLTIGTGIGGGLVAHGRPVHGLLHPEMGHVRPRRWPGDAFAGLCPFHGDCIEGLCSGPAIAARAGRPASAVRADDPLWDRVAFELGQFVAQILLVTSAERIVLGGGVGLGCAFLHPRIAACAAAELNGYLPGCDEAGMARRLVPAALGADAGPLGAIALAMAAAS